MTHFGKTLENELEQIQVKDDKTGKKTQAKRQQLLNKWLPESGKASNQPQFKDPASRR